MRIFEGSSVWLPCTVAASAILALAVYAQPPLPTRNIPTKVGGVAVADILQRLGAKVEGGSESKELDDYSNHFNRTDPNRDGKHTRKEYVDGGAYMTPQARAGIFRAADGNADGVVTRDEYVLNRIITDEAKAIVQGMDDDKDGVVERAEFVKHAAKLLSSRELAEQVYSVLDANSDGEIAVPEYLRVWGRWARVGRKPAEERIATRRAELADAVKKPVDPTSLPGQRRPDGGASSGRPGAGAGPPSVDEVFARFDGNKDGKLQKKEIPAFAQRFILPADADGDNMVTKEELRALRQRQPPRGEGLPEATADETTELDQIYTTMIRVAKARGLEALAKQLDSPDRRLRVAAARQLLDQLAGPRPDSGERRRSARPGGRPQGSMRPRDDERFAKLPDISTFITTKSDRFIVEMDHVTGGHPFRGLNANRPHSGAHVYLGNPTNSWPKGGTAPANYPPIYAAADGIVTDVTPTFRLTTGADRYGVAIAFARDAAGAVYRLHYAIEPFVPEPSKDFYRPFIVVSRGQQVKKGDVIAYMYTPSGQINTHICFRVQPINGGHMAPVIFTREVAGAFHAKWKDVRFKNDGDSPMPPCMGYKLTADENPFGTGPAEAL